MSAVSKAVVRGRGVVTALRLDLIVRHYIWDGPNGEFAAMCKDQWTWRLWSGSRIVATSGSQRYSRRIDCARGAEVGAGLMFVVSAAAADSTGIHTFAVRNDERGHQRVGVRLIDERGAK